MNSYRKAGINNELEEQLSKRRVVELLKSVHFEGCSRFMNTCFRMCSSLPVK